MKLINTLFKQSNLLLAGACQFALALLLTTASLNSHALETITYYHNDALGSPIAASDEAGNKKWTEAYHPYGEKLKNEAAASSNDRWYTGHSHDQDTGLTYMGARYYDPVVGRFMGMDAVYFDEDNPGSFSRYAYANNNPYVYSDPDGNLPVIAVWGVMLAIDVGTSIYEWSQPATLDMHGDAPLQDVWTLPGPMKAVGLGTTGGKVSEALGDITKGSLARGRASEARVLDDLGLPKNTQKVRTSEGASIPDALTKRQSIEIKDCISVSCTRQIRIQTDAARGAGRRSVLITGRKTHVSGPARRAFDDIIRRDDLGPR